MSSKLVPSVALLWGCIILGNPQVAQGAPAEGPATVEYFNKVTKISTPLLVSPLALNRMQEFLMELPVKVSFRLNAEGRVEKVGVTSRKPSRFVETTCSRVLKATKFPPMPPKVIAEQHHNWIDISVTIGGS